MTRIASERVAELFALAESEASGGRTALPNRYVGLARKVGMRYNLRLPAEYRELYCRGCSVYWVEGRTVRTRLRAGRRIRTCLACGRVRRVLVRRRGADRPVDLGAPIVPDAGEPTVAELPSEADDDDADEPE